jgi:hypothetical protein
MSFMMVIKPHFSLRTSPSRLGSEQEKWRGRLDPEAVAALEDGKRIFRYGYLLVLVLALGIVVFNLVGLPALGIACAGLGFAVWVPASARSIYLMGRMNKLVAKRYGLEGRFSPPLSFKVLSSTTEFDRWLLAQRRQGA